MRVSKIIKILLSENSCIKNRVLKRMSEDDFSRYEDAFICCLHLIFQLKLTKTIREESFSYKLKHIVEELYDPMYVPDEIFKLAGIYYGLKNDGQSFNIAAKQPHIKDWRY